jgi:GNAT superfamily N-acetyltransferase
MDGAAMAADGVVLFGGLLNGRAVAMGGYKIIAPGHGEVKSMHVSDEARGQGAGARLLEMILDRCARGGPDAPVARNREPRGVFGGAPSLRAVGLRLLSALRVLPKKTR